MTYPYIKVEFSTQHDFIMHFGEDGMLTDKAPQWAQLKHSTCPGNCHHQPSDNYCRLGVELELLIQYFSSIPSIQNGKITFYKDANVHIAISKSAQHIFCNAVWFLLLHSDCSVFKHNQWLRKHYLPPSEKNDMFYTLFSTYVMEELFISPQTPLDIQKFQTHLDLLRRVLTSLLEQINLGVTVQSDSIHNGLIILNNLIHLVEIGFDKVYQELEFQIREGSTLNNPQSLFYQ